MIEQNVLLLSAYESNKHFFLPRPYYNVALNTLQKIKFSIKDLVTFTEEILNGKLHFFVQWQLLNEQVLNTGLINQGA